VIMDDILVWGSSMAEHNAALRRVLDKARECNLTLTKKKCKIGMKEVSYVGQVLTAEGVKVQDSKVEAIVNMQKPEDKQSLMRFLGMVSYLRNFIPNMSKRIEPLRELLNSEVEWHWTEHDACIQDMKEALSSSPVLAYYDPDKPIIVSVDASSEGLGACLIQNEKPVAYTSRVLNSSEKNYAQIEKEALAIVWGCQKFHDYIYGQPDVQVETDHKPIEILYKKPLASAPPHIQRMRLRTQKYDVKVTYKPGKELYIADTLSRAAVGK